MPEFITNLRLLRLIENGDMAEALHSDLFEPVPRKNRIRDILSSGRLVFGLSLIGGEIGP